MECCLSESAALLSRDNKRRSAHEYGLNVQSPICDKRNGHGYGNEYGNEHGTHSTSFVPTALDSIYPELQSISSSSLSSLSSSLSQVNSNNDVPHDNVDRPCSSSFASNHDFEHKTRNEKQEFYKKMLRLTCVLVLCLMAVGFEVVGATYTKSLAIFTDAAHLLADCGGFAISLLSIWMTQKSATKQLSYGWHRAEIIGGLLSVICIWLVTLWLLNEAIHRLYQPEQIDGKLMFIFASCGLVINLLMMWILHQSGHAHSHGGLPCNAHGHSHGHETVSAGARSSSPTPVSSPCISEHPKDDDIYHHCHHHNAINVKMNTPSITCNGDNEHADAESYPSHDVEYNDEQTLNHCYHHCDNRLERFLEPSSLRPIPSHSHALREDKNTNDDHHHHHHYEKKMEQASGTQNQNLSLSLRSAYIHAIGDALQSIGVMVAAGLIWYNPKWQIADPLCTFFFSALVFYSTFTLTKQLLRILMEGAPSNINVDHIRLDLLKLTHVLSIHDLHIWSVSANVPTLSVHIQAVHGHNRVVLEQALHLLETKYGIRHCTIQIETTRSPCSEIPSLANTAPSCLV